MVELNSSIEKVEKAQKSKGTDEFVLHLYVANMNFKSVQAIKKAGRKYVGCRSRAVRPWPALRNGLSDKVRIGDAMGNDDNRENGDSIETDAYKRFEKALETKGNEKYVLHLFVAGMSPRSIEAIENIKKICEEYMPGRYQLDVIDIYQQPIFAKEGQIVAAPTLLKELPLPLRKLVGSMSDKERVLVGLDLHIGKQE